VKKTKCIDCGKRLYVPRKNMKVRCYDCQLKYLKVDAIVYCPITDAEFPSSYFEVKDD